MWKNYSQRLISFTSELFANVVLNTEIQNLKKRPIWNWSCDAQEKRSSHLPGCPIMRTWHGDTHTAPDRHTFQGFFVVTMNRLLNIQSICWWFVAPWSWCDVIVQCTLDIWWFVGSKQWYRDISGSAIYRATVMSQNRAPFSSALRVIMGHLHVYRQIQHVGNEYDDTYQNLTLLYKIT